MRPYTFNVALLRESLEMLGGSERPAWVRFNELLTITYDEGNGLEADTPASIFTKYLYTGP